MYYLGAANERGKVQSRASQFRFVIHIVSGVSKATLGSDLRYNPVSYV